MGRSKWIPAPQSDCPKIARKHRAEFLPLSSPAIILGDFKVFMGGPFCALHPQSLDLHSVLCPLRVLISMTAEAFISSPLQPSILLTTPEAMTLLSLGSPPLRHPKLWLFSDHPSHLSIPLTLICSLFILRYLSPILPIFILHLLTSFPINSQSCGPSLQSLSSQSSFYLICPSGPPTPQIPCTLSQVWLSTFSVPSLGCQVLLGTFTQLC